MSSIWHNIDRMPRFIWKLFFYTAIFWVFGLFETVKTQTLLNSAFFFETILLILTLVRSKTSWIFLLFMTSFIIISGTIAFSRAMNGSDFEKFVFPLIGMTWAIYALIQLLSKEIRQYYFRQDDESNTPMSGCMMNAGGSEEFPLSVTEMRMDPDETAQR